MLLAVTNDNGCCFGHHCCRWACPNSIKHRGQLKYINIYINLMNLTKSFIVSLGQYMRKAACPSDGVDHGGDVCCVFVLCVAVSSGCCHWYVKKYQKNNLTVNILPYYKVNRHYSVAHPCVHHARLAWAEGTFFPLS